MIMFMIMIIAMIMIIYLSICEAGSLIGVTAWLATDEVCSRININTNIIITKNIVITKHQYL